MVLPNMNTNTLRTVFRYRLARYRGQVLGWGIGLALLGLFMAQFYGTIVDQSDQFQELLDSYPKELMAFFGDVSDLATPSGYLNLEYFILMPLILGVFAVLVGSGLLVSDEESGRLDLILAHPVGRGELFWGRALAFVAAMVGILVLAWLGIYLPTSWTALHVGWMDLTLAYVSLFAVLLLFGAFALMLSLLLPSRRMAAMVSGLALVVSYFVTSLANAISELEPVAQVSPLTYYQGGEALDGLNLTWVVGLLLPALLFSILAWWRFERRDVRVGGEGAWRRPSVTGLLPWRRASKRQATVSQNATARS
jgi:ABC-2 type transport system permease protein